jgi:DNA-binding MarR family transcriptional regulator
MVGLNNWINLNRFQILNFIYYEGEVSIKKIIINCDVTEYTLRKILNEMQELNLIEKIINPKRKIEKNIMITDLGREFYSHLYNLIDKIKEWR